MIFHSFFKRSRYNVLQSQDQTRRNKFYISWLGKSLENIIICVLLFSFCATTGFVGFLSGKYSVLQERKNFPEINYLPVTFKYNRTFADAPSTLTDQLWDSLFPAKRGFFKHPILGPDRFDFAVYHQLHCLNEFRTAYWNLRKGASPDESASSHAHDAHLTHPEDGHIRHCIDFLRQSLMCTSDTTIEVVEKVENGDIGVRGFGTEHKCKDFHQLREWTSQWEDFEIL